jgi:hypothetical protein
MDEDNPSVHQDHLHLLQNHANTASAGLAVAGMAIVERK